MGVTLRASAILVETWVVVCLLWAAFRGLLQWLSFIRLGNAYLGLLGAFLAIAVAWSVAAIAPVLYFSLAKNYPGLWRNAQAARSHRLLLTLALLVGFTIIAELAAWGVGWGIAWLADLDCARTFAAGVTGSHPCR